MNDHDELKTDPMNNSLLDKTMRSSLFTVAGTTIVIYFSYFLWFGWINGFDISNNPEKWGQFGDYVGGLLNPLIALFAFYWLTQSLRIQVSELADTRAEMKEANKQAMEANGQAIFSRLAIHKQNNIQQLQMELSSLNIHLQDKLETVRNVQKMIGNNGPETTYTYSWRVNDKGKNMLKGTSAKDVLLKVEAEIENIKNRTESIIAEAKNATEMSDDDKKVLALLANKS